jgi:hypothetical protein
MEGWSEADFQARVRARIAQLGESESTLLRRAGLTGDEIRKIPKHGRRIDTVIAIARALHWTVGQALGIQDPALFHSEREIDPKKLALALETAKNVIGDNLEQNRVQVLADVACLVYSILSEREAQGLPINESDAVRAVIESTLRRVLPYLNPR